MWNYVVHCFRNYALFKGRASRPEYWWFYLFIVLANVPVYWLADAAPTVGVPLSWVWGALLIVPFLAVMSRRLHDTGHSFWWASAPALALAPILAAELLRPQLLKGRSFAGACFLLCLLAFLGLGIRVLVLLCTGGEAGTNRYGDAVGTHGATAK
jgi:uncharacterized membrane protein YhaH (DUF805 family)